ncbi:MlaD family protein [Amycolatopsis keratiniphila]|uniref:MlaD family protein n=1 Tax=Amycolatopsis keratiniphila TaxID=129921 RepID=UPI00087D0272|nr:MlaD family protein [Amycolatopsis keratiniphila]OLZ42968.1 mammalian cell entry protein [Amycolatopsis keratiniphila subsp. nogabecina]SDU66335.1 phospholipid/cholesterol/gamma-HCH transport system substrate-binding protein [Amycolatopsis keratiniphila]
MALRIKNRLWRPRTKGSLFRLGAVFVVVALVVGFALFNKDRILTTLEPGTELTINFARDYRLQPYATEVKIAGVPIGKVVDVQKAQDGSADVTVKVDDDVPAKLRTTPSAAIRAATVLGGRYYVDLIPGGEKGSPTGEITKDRTQVPVELDKVVGALPPNTLSSLQKTVGNLDATLDDEGRAAIDRLLADAPGTLVPAADVLRAAQGTRPRQDLADVVSGLESASSALTKEPGQLDSIVQNLGKVSAVLGDRASDLSRTVSGLPAALDSTNAGLSRLDGTLAKLKDVAEPARPVASELDTALQHADPVLAKARPLVNDLKNLMTDARPVVRDLVPTTQGLTTVLNDVRGPVLDRINGPIKSTVLSPYRGTGPYARTSGGRPFYQELGYMLSNVDRASSMTDGNGASIAFEPGVGPGSIGGLPISLEQLFGNLMRLGQQQEGR